MVPSALMSYRAFAANVLCVSLCLNVCIDDEIIVVFIEEVRSTDDEPCCTSSATRKQCHQIQTKLTLH